MYKLEQSKFTFSHVVQASNGQFCIRTEHNQNAVLTDDLLEADRCDSEYADELLEWFKIMKPEFTYVIKNVSIKIGMKIQKDEQEAK